MREHVDARRGAACSWVTADGAGGAVLKTNQTPREEAWSRMYKAIDLLGPLSETVYKTLAAQGGHGTSLGVVLCQVSARLNNALSEYIAACNDERAVKPRRGKAVRR